ncbi:hypothetical protein J6590_035411 [Homalodisca vitripennis]|nr:hypothetical protein J6590_035411 [Homalodisca vitripennis]
MNCSWKLRNLTLFPAVRNVSLAYFAEAFLCHQDGLSVVYKETFLMKSLLVAPFMVSVVRTNSRVINGDGFRDSCAASRQRLDIVANWFWCIQLQHVTSTRPPAPGPKSGLFPG